MAVQTGIGRAGGAHSPEEWQAGATEVLQRSPGRFLPGYAKRWICGCGAWRTGQFRGTFDRDTVQGGTGTGAVSYTHLDVYKRQPTGGRSAPL